MSKAAAEPKQKALENEDADLNQEGNEENHEGNEENLEGTMRGSRLESSKLKPLSALTNKPPELLSIEKYDKKNPRPIESPRSLKAMELLCIDMNMIIPKDIRFHKSMATSDKDLIALLKKEKLGIKTLVNEIKYKRNEIIKNDERKELFEKKCQLEKEMKAKKMKVEAEKARKLKEEIEQVTSAEIEKKLEDRHRKIIMGEEEDWPYYDQYNNLTYVPKPGEYFKANVKSQAIKQQLDLSKNKVSVLKEKQLKEMGHMMDYEINLQEIKKRNETMQKQKMDTLKSIEDMKQKKFQRHMQLLQENEKKHAMQKKLNEEIKQENKKRMFMINEREAALRLKKIKEHERKINMMKQSEVDYEQNRKYMVKQLIGDFQELKAGQVSTEEIAQRYAYLKDEEAFEKAMAELNRRRHMSRLFGNIRTRGSCQQGRRRK